MATATASGAAATASEAAVADRPRLRRPVEGSGSTATGLS